MVTLHVLSQLSTAASVTTIKQRPMCSFCIDNNFHSLSKSFRLLCVRNRIWLLKFGSFNRIGLFHVQKVNYTHRLHKTDKNSIKLQIRPLDRDNSHEKFVATSLPKMEAFLDGKRKYFWTCVVMSWVWGTWGCYWSVIKALLLFVGIWFSNNTNKLIKAICRLKKKFWTWHKLSWTWCRLLLCFKSPLLGQLSSEIEGKKPKKNNKKNQKKTFQL